MPRQDYRDFTPYQQANLPGLAGTANILTPQKGTGSETKTHTSTLLPFFFGGRRVKLKKLSYVVTTAQTGAGNNLTLNLYVNTTSHATLAMTTETAGTQCIQTANMDEVVEATDYVRILALSTTTASDANSAVGQLFLTYEELFAASS